MCVCGNVNGCIYACECARVCVCEFVGFCVGGCE